jgi:molybdenum cofactor cytidylyltransferase
MPEHDLKIGPAAGIILAAGESTRFGSPKQLLRLKGRLLPEWVLDAAVASELERVVLVLGCRSGEVMAALGAKTLHPKVQVVLNPDYRDGQSTSLVAGLRAVEAECPAVMFLLGDQPLVGAAEINRLIAAFRGSTKTICAAACRGRRLNPVIFTRRHYPRILALTGDTGARGVVAAEDRSLLTVEIEDERLFMDIDTPADAEALSRLIES